MPVEIESTVGSDTAVLDQAADQAAPLTTIDKIVNKFRAKLEELEGLGLIAENGALTQFATRIEYGSGKTVEWVTSDGQVYRTRSETAEDERPLAPVIPSAVRSLAKLGPKPDVKAVEKAQKALDATFLGFFAVMETGAFLESSWARSLPGMDGRSYAAGRLGQIQRYGDANEKIGLGK